MKDEKLDLLWAFTGILTASVALMNWQDSIWAGVFCFVVLSLFVKN